jgi:hypothetical protein
MYDWGKETVAEQFLRHHGKEALDVMIDCVGNYDDKGERYADNILYGHQLVGNCCFVMTTKDYDRMVEWLFPLLKKIRRRLIGDPDTQEDELKRWRDYAVKHFGEEQADYQMRCISFIGERLISAWIMENLTIIETARNQESRGQVHDSSAKNHATCPRDSAPLIRRVNSRPQNARIVKRNKI